MLQKKLKMTRNREHLDRIIIDQRFWFRIVWHEEDKYYLLKDSDIILLKLVRTGDDPKDPEYSDEKTYKEILNLDEYKPLDTSKL
jgi:hypothetical protein